MILDKKLLLIGLSTLLLTACAKEEGAKKETLEADELKTEEVSTESLLEDASELRSGQIGVFIIDGESYLKKAYKEDNQLRLVSLNDKYDYLIFNEVNDIEVIGTVVM